MSRLEVLSKAEGKTRVCYLMYNSFRLQQNHAIEEGLSYGLPLDIALYHIKEENPRVNEYFLEGIKNYEDIDMKGVTSLQYFEREKELIQYVQPYSHIILDQAYLKEEKDLINRVIQGLWDEKTIVSVENSVMVPVKVTSNKEEYAARTIRSKIWRQYEPYSGLLEEGNQYFHFEKKARKEFNSYVKNTLQYYDMKNDPSLDYTSHMSAYLKYGFISPVYMYNILKTIHGENAESYIEELIVRRELAYNFVYYNEQYYSFDHMTYPWAYLTMEQHALDEREYLYTKEDYIEGKTHDPYFNIAMKHMVEKGDMHGYTRMYWCKKIIEWSPNYKTAYEIAISLNNYYFFDGNTPNGYTGVAWCFGKHDRGWTERAIFGKLRYMNKNGLERKFDMKNYK